MDRGIRLASAPINWGVTGVEPGNPAPEAMLAAVAEAGYEGCELGAYGYFGTQAGEILDRFQQRGQALVTTWHAVDLAQPLSESATGQFRHLGEILEAAGCGVMLISDDLSADRLAVVARVEDHPETWWSDDDLRQARQTLLAIAQIAAGYGLAIALHPHVGGHVESGREIRQLLDVTAGDPVGLCLDTGHILVGGSDPIALLARDGARLVHIHAKDVDGTQLAAMRAGQKGYFEAIDDGLYSELGSGIVDWQGFKRGLTIARYAGWVVAEQDRNLKPGDRRPFESNRRNGEFLKRLLQS